MLRGVYKPADVLDVLETTVLLKGLMGVNRDGTLEEPANGRHVRIRQIRRDIKSVKTELYDPVVITERERGTALGIYRNRLANIFTDALEKGDLRLAMDVCEKLAIAGGVDTKNPVKIDLSGGISVEVTAVERELAGLIVNRLSEGADVDHLFDNLEGNSSVSNNGDH